MSFDPPDWRTESAYPDPTEKTNLSFWAWEFLRRNEEYQKTWAEYATRLQAMALRVPELAGFVKRIVAGKNSKDLTESELEEDESSSSLACDQLEWLHFSPPILTGETVDDWEARTSGAGPAQVGPLNIFLGKKWGLQELVHPARPYSENGFPLVRFMNHGAKLTQSVGSGKPGSSWCAAEDANHPFTGNLVSIQFDLRLPEATLRAQFSAVLAMRKKRVDQKNFVPYKGRPEKSLPLFRNYLRTLDAFLAGEKVAEIATAMLSHQDKEGAHKTVANWKNKAAKIRDGEYKAFPAYTSAGVKKR